jgi:hypothetical protein
MRPGPRCLVAACALAAVMPRASAILYAQDACVSRVVPALMRNEPLTDRAGWQKPLDRIVAFDLGEMSLGRALDRVASQTGVHFSYSPDLVPVQRAVCLSVGEKPLGGLLVALLAGTNVSPVVVGADQIVRAPNRSAAGADAAPVAARSTRVLERVVAPARRRERRSGDRRSRSAASIARVSRRPAIRRSR